MTTYTVTFEVEVHAATPTQAATVARDMMLDPDAEISVNIYPMEWIEEAEELSPYPQARLIHVRRLGASQGLLRMEYA